MMSLSQKVSKNSKQRSQRKVKTSNMNKGHSTNDKKRQGLISEWCNATTPQPLAETGANVLSDDVDRKYFQGERWWLTKDIPENEKCTLASCTFEPEPHRQHLKHYKFLSMVEKKIVVKYLITRNVISKGKAKKIYISMIADGFLRHRSWETIRNCFRRTILGEIREYQLTEGVLNEFLKLRVKQNRNKKKGESL